MKGNKRRAEAMLQEARRTMEAELQLRQMEREKGHTDNPADVAFTQFLPGWLEMMKASVEITTCAAYSSGIKNRIVPYFEEHHPGLRLRQVTPKQLQDYYTYEMQVNGVSANTVIHRHANIRKALQYAFKTGLLSSNPADRIERSKITEIHGKHLR